MNAVAGTTTDLVQQFCEAARAVAATCEIVLRSSEVVGKALLRATAGAERILFAEPHDLPAELFDEFRTDPRVVSRPTEEELKNSPVGVTEAFAGVARTGSICVDASFQLTGVVSLLAPLHVAVMAAETIVPSPRDLLSTDYLGGKGIERDFVFITGPSATADMGPLVRGVHGPHRLHILVVSGNDAASRK